MSKGAVIGASAGSLILGLVIGYSAGHSAKTTTTAASNPIVTTANTPAAPATTAASHPAAAPAKVGSSIVLTGTSSGEKMTVTIVKVTDPAKSNDQFMQPDAGKRLVGVQLRLVNSGTAAYSDSPTNSAKLIDAQGQQYNTSLFGDTNAGVEFSGSVNAAPGATALGVVMFEVPDNAKIATFQFGLDSGFARQTGQWQIGD